MSGIDRPYYRRDLARIHHLGFGFHADNCAPGIRPGGLLALDLCDLGYAETRRDGSSGGGVGADWALITRFSLPSPDRFVREMATFTRNEDGTWRRDDERHENGLMDTQAPDGLHTVIGHRVA